VVARPGFDGPAARLGDKGGSEIRGGRDALNLHEIEPNLAARPACDTVEIEGGSSMNARLPADLERFVQAKVRSGRFTSSDEAITAAVRLLRQQEEDEDARVLEGIRQGLEDVQSGRTQPLAEAFADIRRDLNLPNGP
jgi:putative addiction module CopG family antidote